ncbi:MAG TPA: response regulator [Desulfuromonadales bacterium]|nr:response regulator [Desulfuromonadales bacterium]
MSATVMIVDDSLFMRNIIRGFMRDRGYSVVAEAGSGIETLKKLHEITPDIIFLDIILPDINGLELLESILKRCPLAKVVVCSSLGEETVLKKALGNGAKAFLHKPFTPEKVYEVLDSMEA